MVLNFLYALVGVLHPQGDDYDDTRKKYNGGVKSFGYKMREGYQDSIVRVLKRKDPRDVEGLLIS